MLRSPFDESGKLKGVLLSIHLTSNRPDNFAKFLDRLEEKTEDFGSVEVAIKIDDNDHPMNELLARESKRRPFRIAYISTPLVGGFYSLWRAYNDLLRVCDPNAYFVVGLNDEMYFLEKGWDVRLRNYVNLYPDHIYRLRTSIHRERNYFDYWEACCAGDLSPIMTKRWIDVGGNWCPCNGPDSFQNSVAFYFGWLYRHYTFGRPYRERVVHDINFGGYGANVTLSDPEALRRRMRGGVVAWFQLMSYPMQQEAARRAQKLHAQIWAEANVTSDFDIIDKVGKQQICVIDLHTGALLSSHSYGVDRLRIVLTNTFRKLNYAYYGGAGLLRYQRTQNFIDYLCLRHNRLERVCALWRGDVPAHDNLTMACRVIIRTLQLVGRPFARALRMGLYKPKLIAKVFLHPRHAIRQLKSLFVDSNLGR